MRLNQHMRDLISQSHWEDDPSYAIPEDLQRIVDLGWSVDETGAHLLAALQLGYRGRRSAYTDITGYEAGVNGWGIDARDLPGDNEAKVGELLQRSVSYVREALVRSRDLNTTETLTGMVSISIAEPSGEVVARVTFWASHAAEPSYVVDIDGYSEAVLLMSSTDLAEFRGPV